MTDPWTVRKIMAWIQGDLDKRGFSSPRLDAELLVARGLEVTRVKLYLDLDRPLVEPELARIRALVERRRRHEPMAYILGEREFYGHSFEVNPDVLIPRPDTETLVERALSLLGSGTLPEGPLLDVCTGSGAIAVALALGARDRAVVASDLSEGALRVAARNVRRHALEARVTLRRGDLFAPFGEHERFALIAINPPYIGSHELEGLMPDVRDFEPRAALDAGSDAVSFYRRIAAQAGAHLAPGGVLLVEVGAGQAEQVLALFREAGLAALQAHRDLAGIERVVEGVAR